MQVMRDAAHVGNMILTAKDGHPVKRVMYTQTEVNHEQIIEEERRRRITQTVLPRVQE
jgi:hypothetical protein